MTKPDDDEALELLRRTVSALEPWAENYVLVGGWAMQLFRQLEGMDSTVTVQRTNDVDIALRRNLPNGDQLRTRLEQAKLVSIPSRNTKPPITRFQNAERGDVDLAPVHLEFLVPMRGRGSASTETIGSGVGAQALRYLELSFEQARSVDLAQLPELKGLESSHVRVPSPASYLLAKALVLPKRKPGKRDKDYAYIYLLAYMSRQCWSGLRSDFERLDVHSKWRSRASQTLRDAFASAQAPGVRGVVRSLDDPSVDENLVLAVMQRFLRALGLT